MLRFIVLLGCVLSLPLFAQTNADQVDEVLVIGEQPGPSLWKIYKGDHVLWLMGTLTPLPKKLEWHSRQAEEVLQQSQQLLLPPELEMDASPWAMISALPSMIGIQKNPDGTKLEDAVPPDVYAHWLDLKAKYIGKDNSVEKFRPIFAGAELFEKSIKQSGLITDDVASQKIQKLAKKYKVEIVIPKISLKVDSPKATIKKFKKSSIDDVACFSRTLDRLESDLNSMRARANAWAVGDVETLSKLPFVDNETACFEAMKNSAISDDMHLDDLRRQFEQLWLDSVDQALTNNQSTFAVMPVFDILHHHKEFTERLQAKGYRIEGFGFSAPGQENL